MIEFEDVRDILAVKPKPARVKAELLDWLRQLTIPPQMGVSSWEEILKEFPAESDEPDGKPATGMRLCFAVPLHTASNRYVLSILECLGDDARGVFILCAHVNWNDAERRTQRAVQQCYAGVFDDVLKAKHTIWAQTFRPGELAEGLNASALAILSNELITRPPEEDSPHTIPATGSRKVDFPQLVD